MHKTRSKSAGCPEKNTKFCSGPLVPWYPGIAVDAHPSLIPFFGSTSRKIPHFWLHTNFRGSKSPFFFGLPWLHFPSLIPWLPKHEAAGNSTLGTYRDGARWKTQVWKSWEILCMYICYTYTYTYTYTYIYLCMYIYIYSVYTHTTVRM